MAESVKKRVPVGHTSSENWMEDKLRLNKKQFMVLLKKVKPHIVRRMAERFDPFSTLLEVLKFLATGEGENPSFKSILVVLCGALEEEYFPNFPETHDGWLEVAKDFETKWGVKRTVGAVTSDRVLCDPPKSCSAVYLDKETREHGLYIVTAVDAKYRIMFGGQGNFGSMKTPDFILNTLHLRVLESPFPKSNSKKNAYTMVADLQKGFKHRPWLHVRNDIMPEEYNEEIKRALKPGIIAHEILFSRFGVLSSNFKSSGEEFSCVIFMAVIALHNYFLATNPAYAPEYKDTKKWIDKKIEKIPRSISLNPREVGDEDEWMKKVFISKDIFQQFLNVLDSAKLGLDCDMDMPIRLKICLRFLVTGELYEPLTDVVVTAIDFLKCINLDFYRKIPLTFQGFKKKFQLDNCGGVVVTKRTSNYVPAENTDRLTMYVLVLTERGQIGLSIEVFEFDSSMSFTASAVESLLENMRHSEFLKSNKETRFIVGNNDMKNTDYLITPKAPGGQDRDTVMKVSEFGQKVLKKICSIFKVTKFSRKPSKFNPVFDRGTDLVFSTLHNWLVDNNPDYAKEFLTI